MTSTCLQRLITGFLLLACLSLLGSQFSLAQNAFEFYQEPILYQSAAADNAISRLQQLVESREVRLSFDKQRGYLDSVLKALGIDTNTQALVYSKTSLQLRPINSTTPRALYFNDDTYVGWVPGAEQLEFLTADRHLGAVFYTLKQTPTGAQEFVRDRGACLQCHANHRTQGVPGPLVRSLYTSATGQPNYNFGTFTSDHTSPLSQRWGGYYVTGTHGTMVHMGNLFVNREDNPAELDFRKGANQVSLPTGVAADMYPEATSDIVGLMVLEHQTQMQNYLTKAQFEERRADHYDSTFNLNSAGPSPFTQRRIARSVESLLNYLFFVGEFQLSSPITGTSTFSRDFTRREPRTGAGKSLYELDLNTRVFKYPLSYMIYSQAFESLGPKTTDLLHRRIKEILSDDSHLETNHLFGHLTPSLKKELRKILKETHPTLGRLFP